MSSLYKIYTTILMERLRKEVKGKGIIPSNQAEFRKGMGTMDQIYILNYLINRQLGKEKGGMIALFIDLKAAFDSLDREVVDWGNEGKGSKKGPDGESGENIEGNKEQNKNKGSNGGNNFGW